MTAPIRGRAAELERIGAAVAAVAEGRGGALVIEGPAGIGKTRLRSEFMTLAADCGVRTLFGEAFEYQRAVPFFSLFMATLQADPPVADPESLRRLGASTDPTYWVVHDLADAIHSAAANTPLAIVLEDIHWADNGTLLALRSLASAGPDVAVLWVLTARTGAGPPAVHETLAMLDRSNATFVRVGAMTHDAVAEMVADAVRAHVDESLLSLTVKAHGNPFLVSELVGGLTEEGRIDVSAGRAVAVGNDLPRRLSAGMQQRLDLLADDVAEVVRVASVLPDRFSAALLAAMLERTPTSLLSAVAEAVRVGLLVEDGAQLRFGHDLLREATRLSIPQSLRRAMERQSASIMLSLGADPVEVATQLARSAEPGDREAISAVRQAAQSISRSDAGAAADLSRRALDLLPAHDPEYGRLVAETVDLLNRATRYAESEELAVAALSAASSEGEAEIRLRLPSFTWHNTQRRIEESRQALELTGINDVARARHLALLAFNSIFDDNDGHNRAAAEKAAAAAEAADDLEATVIAKLTLVCHDCADGYVTRSLATLEELAARCRTDDLAAASLLVTTDIANVSTLVGRIEDADEQITAGVTRARREGDTMALDVWTVIQAEVDLAAGRLSTARAAAECLPPPKPTGATEIDMVRMVVLVEVAVATDDRALLHRMVADAGTAYLAGTAMVRRLAAHALALAAWHRGDLHDAVRWFGGDIDPLGTAIMPLSLNHLILAARVASAAGDAGCHARALRATEKLQREQPANPMFTAVATYVRAILESDAQGLVASADMLASSSRPLFYAAAAEDAGGELARTGCTEDAVAHLTAAFDTYLGYEAITHARRVGRELRRLGVERRIVSQPRAKAGWDSLTDAELKIVHLIAKGATNRTAAETLHLSPHTVKTHVHNAFTKLGITSRAQLAPLMR